VALSLVLEEMVRGWIAERFLQGAEIMSARLTILSNPLLYVGIVLLAAVVVAARWEFFDTKRPVPGQRHDISWMVYSLADMGMLAVTFFLVFMIVAFPVVLGSIWPKVAHAMVHPLWRCFGLIFLFGLAVAVNFFKTMLLQLYAAVEVLVGLTIAWGALSGPSAKGGGLFQGVALAGSVYALVTGIGDFMTGREESRKTIFDSRR
jgi:hypothetical protein